MEDAQRMNCACEQCLLVLAKCTVDLCISATQKKLHPRQCLAPSMCIFFQCWRHVLFLWPGGTGYELLAKLLAAALLLLRLALRQSLSFLRARAPGFPAEAPATLRCGESLGASELSAAPGPCAQRQPTGSRLAKPRPRAAAARGQGQQPLGPQRLSLCALRPSKLAAC